MFKQLGQVDVEKMKAKEQVQENLKETIKLKFQSISAENLEKKLFALKAKHKLQGSIKK